MLSTYQYEPEEIYEMREYNSSARHLAECDHIVTLTAMETDESSMLASLHENLQELVNTVPEWEKETQAIHPKWLEHHQSGHLTKDPGCPVCMEESGSKDCCKVNHRRKKNDQSPGVMHWSQILLSCSCDNRNQSCIQATTVLCTDAQEGCSMCGSSAEGSTDYV